jgi:hypothetical protein
MLLCWLRTDWPCCFAIFTFCGLLVVGFMWLMVLVPVGGRYGIISCGRFGPSAMGVWL